MVARMSKAHTDETSRLRIYLFWFRRCKFQTGFSILSKNYII